MNTPRLVRTNYRVRTVAFSWCFAVIVAHLWERGAGPVFWALVALQFAVYPILLYWRAMLSPHPTRAELDNLFLDAALVGVWAAELGFPTWITYAMIGATLLTAAVNRGSRGLVWSAACSAAGAALWAAVRGLHYEPATGDLVTAMCVAGALAYATAVGYVVYGQNRRLAAARNALGRSEERYRLIAENAGDLIALLDTEGRWLYASPSYGRILEPAELAPGASAWLRLHPDDAERVKAAVLRGVQNDVTLRLVDRDGRIRQHKTRIQPLENRILLVSQDVTDLHESEERLLLAAQALEGMTEAIVITAADGTIVTVNRAFCEITGYSRDDVLGQSEKAIRNALQPPEFYDELFAQVLRAGYWSGTTWSRRKNGSVYREWRSIRAVRDAGGATTHYVMVFYEVGVQRTQDAGARSS